MTTTAKHKILIVGGGTAGITVAARLLRKGETDVAVVEPADQHYYQAMWTLVGGGRADVNSTERSEASVMPKKATWIRNSAVAFDPDNNVVECADGARYAYDALIVCPGIQLDWAATEGLPDAMTKQGVASNYGFDLAPKTWELIRNTRSGTAVFMMPSGPIKCAGAPQKIAYLAADHWRKAGVLNNIDIHLVLPTPRTFGIPAIADSLDKVAAAYGINVHTESEITGIDADSRKVTISTLGPSGTPGTLDFDMLHAVPRQSAPDWIKTSPLATGETTGYVEVDKHTHQHVRYPNVFALGDAGSTPNSKTGAAIRKQAPVVVENVLAQLAGRPLTGSYNGYASCPIVTSGHDMLLAEFDYDFNVTPTFPGLNPVTPHRAYWYLKRYGLPFMYWNLMLKGLA
ncbi:pyridine nucleotide-disulfide oxidoreductase [Mycolicibacterium insubricum]|uniref:Pyridine nucleotide-disulfide oxidoreductase n=1 Tax=Mycolicibacterium insubricum TaxID=444597 RepID=A0A1X0DN48_9MYCO|nr:FAD/NAD(P)-binding oxidoreductase [Mycolicibacterium insubricum]MCB9441814.1 NAD(P)/FAD-dependent oxidoreductase [Mycolicibacterium sp.]ORA73834.1 pyridine nucleotide-disulfide oxidoreductase [Mycolicibacterium insubricum]BBZ67422.1 pyridine nucleotide-disulfide oxidoreductase [Mycolicibacterium insubricum]